MAPLHNQFIQCCQAIFLNRAVLALPWVPHTSFLRVGLTAPPTRPSAPGLAGKDLNFNEARVVRAKVVQARVVGPRLFRTKSPPNTNAPPQPDLLCSAQALDSR